MFTDPSDSELQNAMSYSQTVCLSDLKLTLIVENDDAVV